MKIRVRLEPSDEGGYTAVVPALKNDVLRVMIVKHQRRHPNYGQSRR